MVTMNSEIVLWSIASVAMIMVLLLLQKFRSRNLKLPPGPRKLPIIGNIHQFIGVDLFHHGIRDLAKKYGAIMQLQLGEIRFVVISSTEGAKQVMKTHDLVFAERSSILSSQIVFYGRSDIIFSSIGEQWKQLRRISISEFLSSKQVMSFRTIREEEVSNLIASISSSATAGSPINLSNMLFSLAYSVISRAAFGDHIKCNDQQAFVSVLEKVLNQMAGLNFSDLFPSLKFLPLITGYRSKLKKLRQEVDMVLDNIIEEHRALRRNSENDHQPAGNLVQALLNLQENGNLAFPLTSDNMKAIILDMFLGGIETNATVVEWAMSELMRNPRVMHKAQLEVRQVLGRARGNNSTNSIRVEEESIQELNYLKMVTKETLRLHFPGPILSPRESTEECEIEGYHIPKKTRAIINAWTLGRDPKYWEEPEQFYPERFMENNKDYKGACFEFMPFGSGRRICPGLAFGMVNVELALAWLLYYFDWQLCDGVTPQSLDMAEVFGTVVRRKNELHLIPVPVSLDN